MMNLHDIQTPDFIIPPNPAAEEIERRNALNLERWNRKYNKLPKKWIKWEAGNFYDLPQRLRGIAAI